MSLVHQVMKKLGFARPFRDDEIEEAISENIKHDASVLEKFAERATESAGRMVEASARLRHSIEQANVKSFADFEHLIHHGERRRARH